MYLINLIQHIKSKIIKSKSAQNLFKEKVRIGSYTYGLKEENFVLWKEDSQIEIGKFCSFAKGVLIFGGGEHNYKNVSTFPFIKKYGLISRHSDVVSKGKVAIKNDVWVGRDAIILSGITIGNGAVIGARTVVSKNIPDYAIVVGNPMRIVGYRFSDDQIDKLLTIRWWEWKIEDILEEINFFYDNVELFINKFYKN